MQDSYKIAAVVVTYNRLELLKKCIESIRNQTRSLDEIIVVNNSSSDGSLEWLIQQNDLTVITQENSGSAGGQHTGIKTAYEKGYDWIWCMDDDCFPEFSSLEILVKLSDLKYSGVCPIVRSKNGNIQHLHRGNFEKKVSKFFTLQNPVTNQTKENLKIKIDFASFVGLMINARAITLVGLPKKELVIFHDDVEYCLRLIKYGIILLDTSTSIFHHADNKSCYIKRKFFKRNTLRLHISNCWIDYFYYRNLFWLILSKNDLAKRRTILLIITTLLIRVIIYDDYKILRIKFLIKSCYDALTNNFSENIYTIKSKIAFNIEQQS